MIYNILLPVSHKPTMQTERKLTKSQHNKPPGPFSKAIQNKSRNLSNYKGRKPPEVVLGENQIVVNVSSHIHPPERLQFCSYM
jgi:hypothetical protein